MISVRTRPTGHAIAYRVVDEYEAEFILPISTSAKPLSLEQITRQLEEDTMDDRGFPSGGISLGYNELNAESGDFEQLRHFTQIESELYPQLEEYFERVFADWVTENVAARDCEHKERR